MSHLAKNARMEHSGEVSRCLQRAVYKFLYTSAAPLAKLTWWLNHLLLMWFSKGTLSMSSETFPRTSARILEAIFGGCRTASVPLIPVRWRRCCRVFSSCVIRTETWYRALYVKLGGVVYVLHCFTKKTNQTAKGDIEIARKRLSDLKARLAKQKQ